MTDKKKQTEEKQTQGEQVTVSKRKLRETAAQVEAMADMAAQAGVEEVAGGAETVEAARDMAALGKLALAAGASQVARGGAALRASERAAMLSDAVAAAGAQDVAQGADLSHT